MRKHLGAGGGFRSGKSLGRRLLSHGRSTGDREPRPPHRADVVLSGAVRVVADRQAGQCWSWLGKAPAHLRETSDLLRPRRARPTYRPYPREPTTMATLQRLVR